MRTRRGWFGVLIVLVGVVANAAPTAAAEGVSDFIALDAMPGPGGGAVRARADGLEPRTLGTEFFLWDGSTEAGLGFAATVVLAEFAQAFNLNGWVTRVIVCGFGTPVAVEAVIAGVVYDDDGPGATPGTLLSIGEGSRIPGPSTNVDCSDLTIPAIQVAGRVYVGVQLMPSQSQGFAVATDNSIGTPVRDMYARGTTGGALPAWALVTNTQPQIRAFGIGARVISLLQATAPCFDTLTTLCLNNGEFLVEIDWRQPNDSEGPGMDSGLRTNDSGVLFFFNAANLEMLIKVLNACIVNNRYWVFFAATTNVEFHLTVVDTVTGTVRTYFNPLDRPAPPVQDTNAFAVCPQVGG